MSFFESGLSAVGRITLLVEPNLVDSVSSGQTQTISRFGGSLYLFPEQFFSPEDLTSLGYDLDSVPIHRNLITVLGHFAGIARLPTIRLSRASPIRSKVRSLLNVSLPAISRSTFRVMSSLTAFDIFSLASFGMPRNCRRFLYCTLSSKTLTYQMMICCKSVACTCSHTFVVFWRKRGGMATALCLKP